MGYDISLDKVESAMLWLAENDRKYAQAIADLKSCEIRCKRVRARVFIDSDGTVAERHAEAEVHQDTEAADEAYVAALLKKEEMEADRERGDLVIGLWRTMEASRRG